jgi:predicted transcriptional regulator with HTH domain
MKNTTIAITNEIAAALDISYHNVQGALNGADKKYRIENSLVSLGLARCRTSGRRGEVIIFQITPQGKNVARLIKKYHCFM